MYVTEVKVKASTDKLSALRIALNSEFQLIEKDPSIKAVGFTIVRKYITDPIFNMDFNPPTTYEVLIHLEIKED